MFNKRQTHNPTEKMGQTGCNLEVRGLISHHRHFFYFKEELKDGNEVIIIEEKGILKIIPKKKIELAQFFDTLDFGEEILEKLEDWTEFPKKIQINCI